MPVRYIEVNAIQSAFVPATRAYGDIAFVGKAAGTATANVNDPQRFTDPATAPTVFGGDLAAAIILAFQQTPGPTTVWGVRVDATTPDWAKALQEVAKRDVQIVALANTPLNAANAAAIGDLKTHVETVSNTGGDGKERIGVVMLPASATLDTNGQLPGGQSIPPSERLTYIAHRAADDAAAAFAGVIAGYEPHISMILKPITVKQDQMFTDGEIDGFNAKLVNWIADPFLIPGSELVVGEGYRAGGKPPYLDVMRTIDAVVFALKATLIQAIGNLRMTRVGLRGVVTLLQSVLSPLQAREVIEEYTIFSPLLTLLDRDPATLTAAELLLIDQIQASRRADFALTIGLAGQIHRIKLDAVFK